MYSERFIISCSPQIFAKIDLLPIRNDSENKKVAQKYKPLKIPRKLLVTLFLSTLCNHG